MLTRVRRHAAPGAFLDHAGPFLTAREAEHSLILGIAAGLRQGGDAYLAVVERGAQVTAAAVRTPPRNLILSHAEPGAVAALAADLRGDDLPGVTGTKAVALAFATQWRQLTGREFRPHMALRLHRADSVRAPSAVPGELRAAGTADRELLIDWVQAFEREALGEGDRDSAARLVDDRLGTFRLWWDGGPVCMAGWSGQTAHSVRIVHVFTPPQLRGRGYASACVATLTQRLLDGGRRFCCLFTDLANPISNRIYARIGYRPVCDLDDYRFTD